MCGIVGTYHFGPSIPVNGDRMQAALGSIAHRGPDDEGVYRNGRATLGHRRLSIIDTSAAGHQPFTDGTGRYTIVYNGEVFNYQELRTRLEAYGYRSRSQTDTEVVLHLFMQKGPDFLHDLNGFFALAIHDKEKDELFLARDRSGIKPLLWSEHDGSFLFASELRALQALGVRFEMDHDSITQFLSYHYIAGPHTILKNAHKLEPGQMIHVSPAGVQIHSWYDLPTAARQSDRTTGPEHSLFPILDDAVRSRLVADVPVGCFLSGGLDSSIISALAVRHHTDLHTFSIGFADGSYFDESAHAEEVARHIGSTHHAFRLTLDEMAEAYPRFLSALDEPFADSSALLSFLLSERTRPYVKVALSGDGADEVFGGYRKHQAELRLGATSPLERLAIAMGPIWRHLPRSRNSAITDLFRKLERFSRAARAPATERWTMLAQLDGDGDAAQLLPHGRIPATREAHMRRGLAQMQGLNGMLLADVQTVLPYDMLHKVDLTSMAHGLEVRPPFLDHRVVELAFGLEPDVKFRRGQGKELLRRTFGPLLPVATLQRKKQGFEAPMRSLLTGPLASTVDVLLRPDHLEALGVDRSAVRAVLDRMRSMRPGQSPDTVHALVVLTHWFLHSPRT